MKTIKIDREITWDHEPVRLLAAYSAILVEVRWVPGTGNGYLIARHPSSNKSDIRWNADGSVQGRINANTRRQVVQGGTILELHLDGVNPKPEEWVIQLSPLQAVYVKPKKKARRRRKKS